MKKGTKEIKGEQLHGLFPLFLAAQGLSLSLTREDASPERGASFDVSQGEIMDD